MTPPPASIIRQFQGPDGERAILQYDHFERSDLYPHQVRFTPPYDDMPAVVHRGSKLDVARRVWSRIERELMDAGLCPVK